MFRYNGLVTLKPEPKGREENDPLFHYTWMVLSYKKTNEQEIDKLANLIKNGKIIGPRSHDNMTAITTALTHSTQSEHQKLLQSLKILPDYTHPRDIIYLAYLQGKWWSYPLLPLLIPIFFYMALVKYKIRPKHPERLKNFWYFGTTKRIEKGKYVTYLHKKNFLNKTYTIRKHFKTDTEILYWLRLTLPKQYRFIRWTRKLIEPLLKKKYGENWIEKMMEIYYNYPSHPNRELSKNYRID